MWSNYLYYKIILNERDSISTTHKSYLETFELCKFQVVLIVPFKLLWTWSELLTELITLMELHWWIDFFSISTNYCPASLQGGRRFIIFFGKKKNAVYVMSHCSNASSYTKLSFLMQLSTYTTLMVVSHSMCI